MSSEALLETRHDRPRGPDGELLPDDLEDERPEGVERRQLLDPGARAEARMRVDHARQNRIGVAEEVPRRWIGDRAHVRSRRSVSTIWTTSGTVSSRAQSRWSSHASETQLTGLPPAWTTRSSPARWASTD